MLFSAFNTCFTVFAIWIRNQNCKIPSWMERIVINWLGKFMCVKYKVQNENKGNLINFKNFRKRSNFDEENIPKIQKIQIDNNKIIQSQNVKEIKKNLKQENIISNSNQLIEMTEIRTPLSVIQKIWSEIKTIQKYVTYLTLKNMSELENVKNQEKWQMVEQVVTRIIAWLYIAALASLFIFFFFFVCVF